MSANTAMAPSRDPVTDLSCGFDVASRDLITARSLQQRIDRKYLLATNDLGSVLARLRQSHCVLHAGAAVWARYESIYFDTSDRLLYHAHRCGRRPRYKVRIRHHVDRRLSFLEIKHKDRGGRTTKRRLPIPYGQNHLGLDEQRFVDAHTPLDGIPLFQRVSISFRRLTLLGRAVNERLTLDRDLTVAAGPQATHLGAIAIAEVKQSHCINHAGAVAAFRTLHVREVALSKYCLGTILVAPVRSNVFKPALTAVERRRI